MAAEPAANGHDRRRLTAALLGPDAAPEPDRTPAHVVRGTLTDISPHMLGLAAPEGDRRFIVTPQTTFWHGGERTARELRPGQDVLLRCVPGAELVVERVWADLARVTGVITAVDGDTLRVAAGHDRAPVTAVVPYRASGRIRVRHPRLEEGYLFDAVGVRDGDAVRALVPATTQPPYPVVETPPRPPTVRQAARVTGTASWYDPVLGRDTAADARGTLMGLAYPALDRTGDCGPACDRATPCAPLPLLSLGATVRLTNECTRTAAVLPVVACGAAASHFCDRCAACGSQASGRIAELTLAAFVALGGQPEAGCCTATLTAGEP
ncbi:hypothetical protein [Thermobifida cellulosilytica]|uniref:DUF5666 domain-containing protein n=1 Tax=Thermobifida cellulosilytica TB100 TaxID=665004 RepID=A0A147KLG5_THECS|nr:hypothetical protein [Thermobifida cellulosilytica]KUP98152.1 hypothetical protein AC529_03165 [Thermobifida cellulosilytica TB100]